jgi:xylulokinase
MERYLLGIDLGTTALKAVVFDETGREMAQASVEYALLTPAPDVVEVPPEIYWQSLKTVIDGMGGSCDLQKVRAISFSAQGETLLFLDADGKPLMNAIVWMDNRAKKEARALAARFGNETCYEVTGQVSFEPCWPASKVLWVRDNEPGLFQKTAKVLLLEDYIIFRMTGRYVAEGSLLTSTTYWDIRTRDYWPEMLEALSLTRGMLPEIRESGEPVGPLLPEIATELGFPAGVLVATGCLDQAAGALGVGNVREGMFSENIGAAMAICAITRELTYDPNRLMPVHYFALPGRYMMHSFTSGGMNLRWFRDAFCPEEVLVAGLTGGDGYDLLSKEAAQAAPGCDGLVMLPHLSGSMAPDVNSNAKGVFYGFSLGHRKPHFVRAIMESLGYVLMRNIEALSGMGIEVKEVRSLGGGARSDVWNQIKCDVIGREIVTLKCKEAASLGAAILAGKAAGVFESVPEACERMIAVDRRYVPNPENRAVYEQGYRKYKKLFRDLTEMFDME